MVVAVVYLLGGLDWLELKTLDLRFLYANSIPQRGDLACIDIDDGALEKVGRWPWPRDVQAGIISVLAEAGVKALLVDITLGEAETLRTIVPRQADIAFNPLALADRGTTLAFPDYEIRDAIEDANCVYLATDYADGNVWKDFVRSDAFDGILAALERGDEAEAGRRAASVPRLPTREGEPAWAPLLWARLVAALTVDPTLDGPALGMRSGPADKAAVAQVSEVCRDIALQRRVRAWLDQRPERWGPPPFELFGRLESELIGTAPRYGEALAGALREVLSAQATVQAGFVPLERVAQAAPVVDGINPVYFLQARAARRCGFVVFDPDPDGVMRRTRLLVQHEGRVVPQLALAVAFDALGLSADDIRVERGRLILERRDGGGQIKIQIDADGRALVPWVDERDWTRQFGDHLPIGTVWQIYDRRQSIRHNSELVASVLAGLVKEQHLLEHRQYADDLKERLDLDEKLREARYRGDTAAARHIAALVPQYATLLAEGEARLRSALAEELDCIAKLPQTEQNEGVQRYADDLHALTRALAANDEYNQEIATTLAQVRGRVAGKIGLIGYTATALADMTPIPTYKRAPGVISHANLLNGLLAGRMVYWAPASLNMLLTLALGLLATSVSVRRPPRMAAALLLMTALAVAAMGGWLSFYAWRYWIALTPALGAMTASYFTVLVYRYVFLERETRQIATALSQYTSATLARKMAEDAELCRRAETREVTAVFTDLANFTSLSERIGAERTQHVLNVALGRFADVMLRYEGMINKFIGDGIFAFWNPVIYPQADHAVRACETAVELQIALRELIEEQRRGAGDEVFGELVLRIGVATGSAVVGPCGSEQKYDYTCIGDSVNVASRLEAANKFYGTRILISGATLQQTGERFAVRPLGGVQVKGKTQAVPIFELLGRRESVADDALRYAEQFGAAVAAFQRRDWKPALAGFEECLKERSADLAARQYAAALHRCVITPPPEDWNGAIELTEK